jgi:hypothetical protein
LNIVPETGFDCKVQEFPGIYSDTEADVRFSICASQMEMLTVSCAQMEQCSINNTLFAIGGTTLTVKRSQSSTGSMNLFTQKMKKMKNNLENDDSIQ